MILKSLPLLEKLRASSWFESSSGYCVHTEAPVKKKYFATAATPGERKKPTTGPWTEEDQREARRQARKRKAFHRWRVYIIEDERDWYDHWVAAQEKRNAERGLPPWYRDPPVRPPPPKGQGFKAYAHWWIMWHWFNWEMIWLGIILAPMFAVLFYL